MKKLLSGVVVGVAVAGLAGCGGGGKNEDPAPAQPMSPAELVKSDLNHFRVTQHDGFKNFDDASGGIITQIFGGTTTADLTTYLDNRLHYYVDPNDPNVDVLPHSSMSFTGANDSNQGVIGAINIGTALWLHGMIFRTPVTFLYHGDSIPVDSSRIGIMLMGPGYQQSVTLSDGTQLDLPPEYRESILIHEARHSDCTGGITETFLDKLRAAPTSAAMNEAMGGASCGHLHVLCPANHPLAGQPACDNEAWGAYTVGEYYYRAVAADSTISSLDYNISQIVIRDLKSRTLVSRLGTSPDMSTGGLIQP